LDTVTRHAVAEVIHPTELALGIGMALLAGENEPSVSFDLVSGNPLAPGIHVTEAILGFCIALLASPAGLSNLLFCHRGRRCHSADTLFLKVAANSTVHHLPDGARSPETQSAPIPIPGPDRDLSD
jgi:hypothetical protein